MDFIGNVHWLDILVIALFFILSIGVGVWTICRSGSGNVKGFFLAGRNMVWWPIGMSLFASNIGANNFVGMAGSGAASGLAVIMFEWSAVINLILLGWIFLPVYIASGIYTMPEYLKRRFGGTRLQTYLAIISLLTYLFATISADLYTGAIFIQQMLGINIYIGVVTILVISAVYTSLGGLSTVIFTDALAVIIMVVGGMVLFIMAMIQVGGWEGLEFQYKSAAPRSFYLDPNTTCGTPREDAFNVIRDLNADYPWFGLFTRCYLGGLWYWCANQVLVQRALAAKNMMHAKAGCIFCAYLKLLPLLLIVVPGMISRALYPDDVACNDPDTCEKVCANPAGCSNTAYPKLILEILPKGLTGLMIAVMLAAVISSLTSIFNSASTLITLDIWRKLRPSAGEREILIVGKVFILLLACVSILWIPLMQSAHGGEMFKYTSTITGYLAAPICAMFLLGLFWNRTTEQGVFWGMLISQVFGLIRFVADFIFPQPACGETDNRPGFVKNIHGFDYAFIQIALAFVAIIIISYITEPPSPKMITGMTFWTRYKKPQHDSDMEKRLMEMSELKESCENSIGVTKNGGFTSASTLLKKKVFKDVSTSENNAGNIYENVQTEVKNEDYSQYETHEVRMAYLKETKIWGHILNINAVLVVGISIFLISFFA